MSEDQDREAKVHEALDEGELEAIERLRGIIRDDSSMSFDSEVQVEASRVLLEHYRDRRLVVVDSEEAEKPEEAVVSPVALTPTPPSGEEV